MKLSLKFQGHEDEHQLMTAKVPVTIFSHPFITGITASTNTNTCQFSFSLSTNFPSGPSLKLSYSPTPSSPFSLSLKSGLGIFGSPNNSPLLFSANFSLSPTYTPLPTFFLHFKPQFGHFSLNKTVFSDPNPPPSLTNPATASLLKDTQIGSESESGWQELKLEPCGTKHHMDNSDVHSLIGKNNVKCGLTPPVAVMAKTAMPLTKGLFLNLRWAVKFPRDSGVKRPYLTVNKIGLERVEEVKQNKQGEDPSDSDLQLLKGMCFWMTRDLEIVEKENRELKRILDEMKMGVSTRNYREKLPQHSGESSGEFERWRSKKSGREENENKEPKKPQSLASDVESELQKAIKAASS